MMTLGRLILLICSLGFCSLATNADAEGTVIPPYSGNGSTDGLVFEPATLNIIIGFGLAPITEPLILRNSNGLAGESIAAECSLDPIVGSATIIAPAFFVTLAPGDTRSIDVSCQSAAQGTSLSSYRCLAAGSEVVLATAPIQCSAFQSLAIPFPNAGSTIAANFGPISSGNTAQASVSFSENNAFLAGYQVSCEITDDGNGAFTIVGDSAVQIGPGETRDIVLAATPTSVDSSPSGVMICNYLGGASGSVTVILGVTAVPEIVPSLNAWALLLLLIGIVAIMPKGVLASKR